MVWLVFVMYASLIVYFLLFFFLLLLFCSVFGGGSHGYELFVLAYICLFTSFCRNVHPQVTSARITCSRVGHMPGHTESGV